MLKADRRIQARNQRRAEIIDAAERIFSAKGYNTSTIDDVCKEADYSRRTVYQYFRDKEQLHHAVILTAYQDLNERLRGALRAAGDGNGYQKIVAMGEAYLGFTHDNPDRFRMIAFHQSWTPEREDDEVRAACYAEGEVAFGLLLDAIREGQADGSIDSQLDPSATALLLTANVNGLGILLTHKQAYIRDHYGKPVDELAPEFIGIVARALQPERRDD